MKIIGIIPSTSEMSIFIYLFIIYYLFIFLQWVLQIIPCKFCKDVFPYKTIDVWVILLIFKFEKHYNLIGKKVSTILSRVILA